MIGSPAASRKAASDRNRTEQCQGAPLGCRDPESACSPTPTARAV